MTRVYAYRDIKGQPLVGVEWQGRRYNFTLAWELYKQIKLNNQGPSFLFVQLIIEMDLFHAETFDELFETLQQYRPLDDLVLRGDLRVQIPIERPQKIIGIGRNYRKHAEELGNPVPEMPVLFAKAPSAMIASGESIRLPRSIGAVHHEGELAVVIGKRGHDIRAQQAAEHIAGYTIVNDVTARDLQLQDKAKGLPWFRAKGFDSFCPIGPCIVPAGALGDPQALELEVTVNGEQRQRAHTREMLTPVAELVAYISRYMTLMEGDIIATGTPAGVGPMRSGDRVCVSISKIGILENDVV